MSGSRWFNSITLSAGGGSEPNAVSSGPTYQVTPILPGDPRTIRVDQGPVSERPFKGANEIPALVGAPARGFSNRLK